MIEYESLEKLYYQKKNSNEEYERRFNNPCCYNSGLKIHPIKNGERITDKTYFLFYLPINKINLLEEKIFLNSKTISELNSKLPKFSKENTIIDIMVNEIVKTNNIEGIHSTKKEIYESMNKENSRAFGIINKYIKIINKDIDNIDSPQKIREIYDDIFSMDILENPENKLDGKLFRKGGIKISNGFETIHSGNPSEDIIIEHLNDLINFMNKKDIPSLIKCCITHYYFEYIHPFYDGNGRFGRVLLSIYLARKIDIYTGLSISYSIFEDRKKYAKLFLDTSKERNYGEVTFFIIEMLNFIIKGQKSIIEMLEENISKLEYAEDYLKDIKKSYTLSDTEINIIYIYIQNYIFSKENPLTDKTLLTYIENIKTIQTLRKSLNRLTELELLTTISTNPYKRTIGNIIKDIFD